MAKHWLIKDSNNKIVDFGDGDSYTHNFPSSTAVTSYNIYVRDEYGNSGETTNYRIKKTSTSECSDLSINKSGISSRTVGVDDGEAICFQPDGTAGIIIVKMPSSADTYESSGTPNWVHLSRIPQVETNTDGILLVADENSNANPRSATITISFSCKNCENCKLSILQMGTGSTCTNTYFPYTSLTLESTGVTNYKIGYVGRNAINTTTFQISPSNAATVRIESSGVVYLNASGNSAPFDVGFIVRALNNNTTCNQLNVTVKKMANCSCSEFTPSTTSVTFPSSGGTALIGSANYMCNVNGYNLPNWLSITRNMTNIYVSAATNNSDSRTFDLALTFNNGSPCTSEDKKIYITQSKNCSVASDIVLTSQSGSYDYIGTGFYAPIGSVSSGCKDSLIITSPNWANCKTSDDDDLIKILVSPNTTHETRMGIVTLNFGGTFSKTYSVTQSGRSYNCNDIVIDDSIEYDQATRRYMIYANSRFSGSKEIGSVPSGANIGSSVSSWASITNNNGRIKVSWEQNNTGSNRQITTQIQIEGSRCTQYNIAITQVY